MNRHPSRVTPDTAEAWVARLDAPDCTLAERDAFARWRADDPVHAETFARARLLHDATERLRDDPLLRAAALQARRRTAGSRQRGRWWRVALPLAAAASLLLAFGVPRLYDAAPRDSGEQHWVGASDGVRAIRLPDGTQVTLDVDAALYVRFDDRRRLVILERGRAQFGVAPSAIPFEVRASENVIRDVGTTFQVSDTQGAVTVGLLDGVVAVSRRDGSGAQTLAPAQQIHIAADGSSDGVQPMDADAARGWTRGELLFRQRRLDDLLETMNRYSVTKVRLGDARLGDLQVSGSFHAGDQEALVKALEAGWSLRAERGASHEFVLYPVARTHTDRQGAPR